MNKEEEKKQKPRDAIKEMLRNSVRLIKLTFATKASLVLGTFAIFSVVAGMTFASPGVRGLLINELANGVSGSSWSSRIVLLLALVILFRFIPDILYKLREYWRWVIWFAMEEKFNLMMLHQRGVLDVATHEDPKTQDLFTRVDENGVWRMSNFMDRMFFMLQNVIELIFAGAIIFSIKWWLLLILLAGIIPELVVESKYGRSMYGIDTAKAEIKRRYWHLQWHFKNLSSLVEIKLSSIGEHFLQSVSKLFRSFRGPEEETERLKFKKGAIATLLAQVAVAISLVYTVDLVIHGKMQIGTLTFIFATVLSFREALSGLFQNLASQYKDSMYLTDIFKFFDFKPRISNVPKPHILPPDVTPTVVFDNVSFSYPGQKELIIKNLNLRIEAGKKLAIVGINGAGKTTLIKLLCRFYDPTKGRITVDGVDLKQIDLESWYAHLGALFQDYARYNFLVKDAIAVTNQNHPLDIEMVKSSANSAEADTFIEEWSGKYNQMLGKDYEEGIEPSIGQWQKLALARTFYRDPRILILDEPTASIDAEAEAKIFERLEKLPSDRTVILISHRFSTVRHADTIIILEEGKVSEQGTHKELVALGGTYARLFKLQAKGYK